MAWYFIGHCETKTVIPGTNRIKMTPVLHYIPNVYALCSRQINIYCCSQMGKVNPDLEKCDLADFVLCPVCSEKLRAREEKQKCNRLQE